MTFGQRLQYLLYEHDILQKQLALDLKLPRTTLNSYINDRREPDFKTLLQIAGYFHVSTDYLLGNLANTQTDVFDTTQEEFLVLHDFRVLTIPQKELIKNTLAFMKKQNSR